MPEVVGMAIVPALHGLGCDTSIEFLMVVISPGHCGLVDQVLVKAETQSVDTKSLSTLGLYKDQLRTQILKNKYQLGTKSDSKKED